VIGNGDTVDDHEGKTGKQQGIGGENQPPVISNKRDTGVLMT
jgi:hypothetical protein